PLIDFQVENAKAGETIQLKRGGGTLQLVWEAASVVMPMSQIEFIVNGTIYDTVRVDPEQGQYTGSISMKIEQSSWIAVRVRGKFPDKEEVIAAHTSAVMVLIDGEKCFNAADAQTILEQIEGAKAYLETIGTKAEQRAYQR